MINKPSKLAFLLMFFIVPILASAQESEFKIPEQVKVFIEKNTKPIAIESADLNGDGKADYILVLEKTKAKTNSEDIDEHDRILLILVRSSDGKLMLAKRNDKVVYCSKCGGAFGDPFVGVEVKSNSFTINHYGGSNWRWSDSFKFNYSRLEQTWQLVLVVKETFNALNPNQVKTKTITPKKFGKIDIADFDPDKIK